MRNIVDIAVFAPHGKLQLVVEVKRTLNPSRKWAARMRRNLLVHELLPPSPFFLLACSERLYLWKDSGLRKDAMPQYDIDMEGAWRPYRKVYEPLPTTSDYSLEIAVSSWLNRIVNSHPPERADREVNPFLFGSGLYDAIWGGSVSLGAEL